MKTTVVRAQTLELQIHEAAAKLNDVVREAFAEGVETCLDTTTVTNQQGTTTVVFVEGVAIRPSNLEAERAGPGLAELLSSGRPKNSDLEKAKADAAAAHKARR